MGISIDNKEKIVSENYNLSDREIATILCALRSHQEKVSTIGLITISSGAWFDEVTPLGAEEIDTLCKKLNIGESTITITVANNTKLDMFEAIAGYVKLLEKTDPGIVIVVKRGV